MTVATPAGVQEASRPVTHRQEALSLSIANGLDRVIQFGLPLVLTRLLSVSDFGQYRIFWLVTLTVSGLAPLGMPRSLFFFLPRSEPSERRSYIDNTLLFLVGAGLLCAVLVILGGRQAEVPAAGYLTPVFVVLWVVTCLLDLLPTADQRVRWQAGAIVALSIVRTSLLILAALTRNVTLVFGALMIFIILKLGVLLFYIGRYHGWRLPRLKKGRLLEQLRYSVPFGVDGALYSLRGNAEHWIVVLLFLPWQYAVFAIVTYLMPVVDIVRGSISNVLLPRMSETLARGNTRGMIALSSDGALAFLFANANGVIGVLFPSAYAGAAPIMRVYVVALARLVLETTGILMLLQQGRFIMTVSSCVLVVAGVCSYLGARVFGLAGAALGGLVAYYVEAAFSFRRISRLTGIPVRGLQDWPGLAAVLGASVVAAAASAATLQGTSAQLGRFGGLGLSAGAMVLTYAGALELLGYGWISRAALGRAPWRARAS
jgi:O-antigen/teichoic acid export membrane protein